MKYEWFVQLSRSDFFFFSTGLFPRFWISHEILWLGGAKLVIWNQNKTLTPPLLFGLHRKIHSLPTLVEGKHVICLKPNYTSRNRTCFAHKGANRGSLLIIIEWTRHVFYNYDSNLQVTWRMENILHLLVIGEQVSVPSFRHLEKDFRDLLDIKRT